MNRPLACLLFALTLTLPLQAYQPYHATTTVSGSSTMVSAPNLVDLSKELSTASLELLIPTYTPTSAVSIAIDLRGINLLTAFASNSTTLTLQIPQLGISQTFEGATRDESLKLLKDYIRDGGSHHRLFHAYARYSPIDPIAGNPNSLMAQMAQADYLLGRLSPLSGCDCSFGAQPNLHQFQTGISAGRAFSKKYETTTVTLPSRYSYSPDHNWAFIIDAPLTYNRNDGASSLYGSLGLGLRVPVTSCWSLTPTFRMGAGGSLDLCTAGFLISSGVTSVFNYTIGNNLFSLTNYAGYLTSTNLWLTGVNFNYDLHSYLFKNGVTLTACEGYIFCNKEFSLSFTFIDSYFAKDRLYINHYDEVGVSLITTRINPCLDYDSLALSFAFQYGQKRYHGYTLNMIYQF